MEAFLFPQFFEGTKGEWMQVQGVPSQNIVDNF